MTKPTTQLPPVSTAYPLFAQAVDATKLLGFSCTELYRRLAIGQLHGVKMGKLTLIDMQKAGDTLRALPAAVIEYPTHVGRRGKPPRAVKSA